MPTTVAERNVAADEYIQRALDPALTNEMAVVFGNNEPEPAKLAFYDRSLEGTGTFAYYVNPNEIKELYGGRNLPPFLLDTAEPYIGLNPELNLMPKEFVYSVIDHEKSHGAQQKGKRALSRIRAYTPFGGVPLGTMLVEGWNEYGLERRGRKAPSRYFDELYGYGSTAYSQFRDFVYEVEEQAPGITRQIIRAAGKGGSDSAIRLIEGVPNIDKLVTKYAFKLGRLN